MKLKKAMAPAEVAKALADRMGDASDDDRAAEAKKRCETLKEKGLLIEQLDLDDLEADFSWCGRSGSPTKVHRIQSVVLAGGQYSEYEPTEQGVGKLVGELIEDHTIG